MTLALFGGKPTVERLDPYSSISVEDIIAAKNAIKISPLSGFLGGNLYGGSYVQRLEQLWAAKFSVAEAIACNSATSGLLAAAAAIYLKPEGRTFTVSAYTMSATAAAPKLLGMKPRFCDVSYDTFCITPTDTRGIDAIVATNLFGHPADLISMKELADKLGIPLIEDNAQAPLAKIGSTYAGTVGHIGVFSLNVHKHIQCGEGGVVVTNNHTYAERIRRFINHGEMSGGGLGLNLRMTEYTAAIAISQLKKIDTLVESRIRQAKKLIKALEPFAWLKPPVTEYLCEHVYYAVPFLVEDGFPRDKIVKALAAEGFPLVEGYVNPLYRLPAFQEDERKCPVAERLHDRDLVYFENCAWTVTDHQIEQFSEACRKVERDFDRIRHTA